MSGQGAGAAADKDGGQVHDEMQDYYGKVLPDQVELPAAVANIFKLKKPPHVQEALELVHPDVTKRFFGCGVVIPEAIEGLSILDLGSGAGVDAFTLSKLVGPGGSVKGVDMTLEQAELAKKFIDYHTKKFGYSQPNIDFFQGYIERLDKAGVADNTYDILVSNGVVCLCPDKMEVLKEAFRVLKPGGEMLFSDVYANQDVPEKLSKDPNMWGQGYGGSLWWQRLYTFAPEVGFTAPRMARSINVNIKDPQLLKDLGDMSYTSVDYRLYKLDGPKQDACSATYNGGITGCDEEFVLDCLVRFKKGVAVDVSSEVASILKGSRLAKYFCFAASTQPKAEDSPPNPFDYGA